MASGLNVILSNESKTIGLVEMNNPKDHFVCEVDPLLLKQWAEMVYDQFSGEDVVYLAVHKHPDNSSRVLTASMEHGDELQVVVCGTDCDDIKEMK